MDQRSSAFLRATTPPGVCQDAHTHLQQQRTSQGASGPALDWTEDVTPCPQEEGQRCPVRTSPAFPREDGGNATGIALLSSAQNRPHFCHATRLLIGCSLHFSR